METSAQLASRMGRRRAELGLTFHQLAARMTKSQPSQSSVHFWQQGKRHIGIDQVEELAQALEVSPAWLCGFTDERTGSTGSELYATLPPAELSVGETTKTVESDTSLRFSEKVLKQHHLNAADLLLVTVPDNSLSDIGAGDLVLIDRTHTTPTVADLYALMVNGTIWFRWINPELDGSFTVGSGNDGKIAPTTISADRLGTLRIIGRAVAVTRFR